METLCPVLLLGKDFFNSPVFLLPFAILSSFVLPQTVSYLLLSNHHRDLSHLQTLVFYPRATKLRAKLLGRGYIIQYFECLCLLVYCLGPTTSSSRTDDHCLLKQSSSKLLSLDPYPLDKFTNNRIWFIVQILGKKKTKESAQGQKTSGGSRTQLFIKLTSILSLICFNILFSRESTIPVISLILVSISLS